jgi:hypothetical protein
MIEDLQINEGLENIDFISRWCEKIHIYYSESSCDRLQLVYLLVSSYFGIEKYGME